jgi:pimeloyl-ACP methyl ester carboxylesterase
MAMMIRPCLWAVVLTAITVIPPLPAQGIPVPGQPYVRYGTVDTLGRHITFYVSEKETASRVPLLVFVQGSGYASHFSADGPALRPGTGHASLVDAARGRARVLIVEKPGVEFGDNGRDEPGTEFRREHTLHRWTAAISAAIRAATCFEGIDSSSVTVLGHSEGGIAAARLATTESLVSRAVLIAGEGPTQLFSLIRLVRSGDLLPGSGQTPDARERALLASWDSVLAAPDDPDRLFFGHAYRRWSTFLGSSPLAELEGFTGSVLIVQGTSDRAVDPSSAEVLLATLRSRGQHATLLRIEGADHSLRLSNGEDGWSATLERIVDWSLAAAP